MVLGSSTTVNAPRYNVRVRNGQMEVKRIGEPRSSQVDLEKRAKEDVYATTDFTFRACLCLEEERE